MIKNLDSGLARKLAQIVREMTRIYTSAHISRQVLGRQNFLTLLHWVFRRVVQVWLEYTPSPIARAILEGLPLGIASIHLGHLARGRLGLVRVVLLCGHPSGWVPRVF